jgi:hypothetical protein
MSDENMFCTLTKMTGQNGLIIELIKATDIAKTQMRH